MAHISPRNRWDIVAEVEAAGSCQVDGEALRRLFAQDRSGSQLDTRALDDFRSQFELEVATLIGAAAMAMDRVVFIKRSDLPAPRYSESFIEAQRLRHQADALASEENN